MRQFKPGQLQTGSLYPISASFALTASYAQTAGVVFETGSLVTTASFNAFTASYNSGSFTGSFYGDGSNLTGIVSSKWTGSNPISRDSNVEITGSLNVTGGITASLYGTASWAENAISSSYARSSSFSVTSTTASYAHFAATASSADHFDVRSSLTASGLIYPNADNGEESFIQTDGAGNLTLQYVKTIYEEIVNGESTQLVKGTPVYVSGSQGAASIVYRADAGNPAKMPVIYIAADTLEPAEEGRGIALGLIKGVNTTGYPAGTEIYVGVGGGWTDIRPTGSAIVQTLGYVTKEGSGGQGVVLNPGPNSLPNLPSGSVWVGNSGSIPTAVATSSLSVASASFALTASYVANASSFPFTGSALITGSLGVTGSLSTRAQGATSSDIAFRVRNSTDTFNLLSIDGAGLISGRTDGTGGFNMNYQGTTNTTVQLTFNNGNPTLRVANNSGGHAFNVYTSTDNREYLAGLIGKATLAIGANPLAGTIKPNEANTNTLYVFNGTAPSLNATDAFQLYSADRGGVAGKASPHFRTEDGTTIWLGDESRLFNVTASRTIISSSQSTASGSSLTVYGSGSTQPVFTVQGSQGELFSVTDSLSGSLFSVNDISGLPILEVFSDNTTLIGNYLDPMLITTAKVTQTNSGSFTVYSLPTASYDTAFFEYSIKSGSNARAGTIMAIQSGSSVNFTETTTTDFGNTSAVSFTVIVTGSNMALTGSSTSGAWTIKSIVRGL